MRPSRESAAGSQTCAGRLRRTGASEPLNASRGVSPLAAEPAKSWTRPPHRPRERGGRRLACRGSRAWPRADYRADRTWAVGCALVGALIARGGAREVANITLRNQLEVDRRKALREHRRSQLERYRDLANRRMSRYGDVLSVLGTATTGADYGDAVDNAMTAALQRLNEDNIAGDFAHLEVEEPSYLRAFYSVSGGGQQMPRIRPTVPTRPRRHEGVVVAVNCDARSLAWRARSEQGLHRLRLCGGVRTTPRTIRKARVVAVSVVLSFPAVAAAAERVQPV